METNYANIMVEEEGIALAHCPFCGSSEAVSFIHASDLGNKVDQHAVCCDASTKNALGGCGAVGGFALSKIEAANHWNRRSNA